MQRDERLRALHARLASCRRCADAGYPVTLPPVVHGSGSRRAYILGLAPGATEAATGRPRRGPSGRTLRRWLRLDEDAFAAAFTCSSVTRCYPGRAAHGRGDRRPSAHERRLCAEWGEHERALLRPTLVVTVGAVALRALLGRERLADAVGKSFVLDGAVVVPLPHPSGASAWTHDPTNRARLGKALTHVRRELERVGAVPPRTAERS